MIAMYLGNENGVAKAVYSIEVFRMTPMKIAVESKDKCFQRMVYNSIEDFINDWDCHVCDCKIDTDDARIKNEQNTAKEKPVLISQKEALKRSEIGAKEVIKEELNYIGEKIAKACDKGDTKLSLTWTPVIENIDQLKAMNYVIERTAGMFVIRWDIGLEEKILQEMDRERFSEVFY